MLEYVPGCWTTFPLIGVSKANLDKSSLFENATGLDSKQVIYYVTILVPS